MLKWTVMARRDADKPEEPTPSSARRRRHSSAHRRSSTARRRSGLLQRNSLGLDIMDKENQFTSTPIKGDEHHPADALRDLSNLSAGDNRRVLSAKKTRKQPKKKKHCLNPAHPFDNTHYFQPFEAVDSHIEGILAEDVCGCKNKSGLKRRVQETYAPTLPTFAMEYSPCFLPGLYNTSPISNTPLGKYLSQELPSKKPRIDHVNDFLHQITFVTSSEEDKLPFSMEMKSNIVNPPEAKVSPLVKKFLDLKFSQFSPLRANTSSFINDLSLDQIVDAILESSSDESDKSAKKLQKENELNETQEENLLNTENERLTTVSSSDSGFKSSTTEVSHQLEGNFTCKCSNEKTIINLNETFNERCVDEVKPMKRYSSSPVLYPEAKRPNLMDKSEEDNINFTLKRQKCIRRRRTDDERRSPNPFTRAKVASPARIAEFLDDTFASPNLLDQISDDNKSTPIEKVTPQDNTFTLLTPVENHRRFRRCLLFESPTSLSESAFTSNSSIVEVRGSMDLHIRVEGQHLLVNVIRCKDLYRANGKPINAYVKVALSDRLADSRRKRNGTLQRTAVQADSRKPFFNHIFKFPLQDDSLQKRLHIEVWHRDRSSRTSAFLGCMSFDVSHASTQDIIGSYRLLPQSTGRCQNVPITLDLCKRTTDVFHSTMCESQSSVEDLVGVEDLDSEMKKTPKTTLTEQQKHADENLFLRYLELDPTEGPDAIPAATQRKATGNKNGRTPFTQTKRLVRPPKSGFGFSVVWTHPPRIERVEKGLPAEKAGILPGDYIIFVDKHNVVMMPEIDILNLIRSYGSQLTLEIFRRNSSRNGSVPSVIRLNSTGTCSTTGLPMPSSLQRRPSTVCSTNTASVDFNKRKLHLPQVTFSAEKPSSNQEENRKKVMYQLISKEQQYSTGLQFALTRFVAVLAERPDLITPAEHRILFQNADEILRISEDILDNLTQDDGEPQVHLLIRTYHAKLNDITSSYRRYCSGIKKADCVLANKTQNSNSEFVRFLQTPSIPRRRPDITTFIHKPLEHYREVLKLLTLLQSSTKSNHEDFSVINQVVHDLQATYREITAEGGLMEPTGEGRPLLSVQDLENRLVFTKCKPFVLNKPGRQWIFGGDLGRVEGRNVRQYWTLLFSDLLLFAKVSRDRVLFIIEEPLPLANISDMFFNIRKKDTEFRINVVPGGRNATSPTVHCGPDLTRTPRKNAAKKTIILRAPTTEMKAVWQNLLQRQIFHVNSGLDGSSFSSPLESPDAPITSSVATLQSAESLSFRRQTPQNINESEIQKQIDALIEHKCKQLSKNPTGKGNAIHLEKWMKGQLDAEPEEDELLTEDWTDEMLRKRSEELHLIDAEGNIRCLPETRRDDDGKCEELVLSDHDQSPSKSTTTESQVTVRSSPLVPETVPVCRQCHKNCLPANAVKSSITEHHHCSKDVNDNKDDHDFWTPLLLMGLSAINPAVSLMKIDPFAAPIPQINVAPPTPESTQTASSDPKGQEGSCSCRTRPEINNLDLANSVDISPDDSPQTEEPPYHSLSSSNLTLRRFGTVSSLERFGNEDEIEGQWEENNSSFSDEDENGIDNEAFYHSSIRNWTAKAGSYVAEKMAFFERLGEDYRSGGKFFERYLKTAEHVNGEDLQEEETSGATSGEEIWGTPTSGGELDDPLSSPNYEGDKSPYDGSVSSDNGDDTELMMDELLMTPPISGAIMRGLLPRRTLEPLIEEDCSESCSLASSGTSTDPSVSPEQGSGTGDVADTCSTAAERQTPTSIVGRIPSLIVTPDTTAPKIHRSESYRRIVEAAEEADDHLSFFNRFKPTIKFINIERVPGARSVKIFEFFNMKRERRIHQTIPEGRQVMQSFTKEDTVADNVPTSYSEKPLSPRHMKDKQLDRRFWKQLSKRRANKMPDVPA